MSALGINSFNIIDILKSYIPLQHLFWQWVVVLDTRGLLWAVREIKNLFCKISLNAKTNYRWIKYFSLIIEAIWNKEINFQIYHCLFTGGTCHDTINNCANYGQAVCTDPQYTQWVKQNCAQYCNQCGGRLCHLRNNNLKNDTKERVGLVRMHRNTICNV